MNKLSIRGKPLALIVDDDASSRVTMRAALVKAGIEVIEAEDGPSAVESFQTERPDLILLDVVMPDMDGYETCAAIRQLPEGKYAQILMVTALEDIESIERAFDAGANEFVSKPLNLRLLGYTCRYMLRAGRAFHDLDVSQKRLAKTQEVARIGHWEIDFVSNEFKCSPEACQLLGLKRSAYSVTVADFLSTIVPEDQKRTRQLFDAVIASRQSIAMDYRVMSGDNRVCHILNQAEVLHNENGEAEMLLGAVQDVTELKRAEEKIRRLAFYDTVTSLPNRTLFYDRLGQEIIHAQRQGQTFAILFLDLDGFKRINDTYGHNVGDLLLMEVANILKSCVRKSDTASRGGQDEPHEDVARFGGDEYTIMLANIQTPENAAVIARRIVQEIGAIKLVHGYDLSITASIGISIYPVDGAEQDVLLMNADSAMYQAKSAGKNGFSFFDRSLNLRAVEQFSLERSMDQALVQGEFVLYYQPKIDLATRKIVSAEALIRWNHPEKGLILPEVFIPIAEESGKITDVNKWVIREACRQKSKWVASGVGPVNVSVNLSGYQLATQNIVGIVEVALDEFSIDAPSLELELTENVLMKDVKNSIAVLEELKKIGVILSLDDFGKGYSSLSYLTSFGVDNLKIDEAFVINPKDAESHRIIIKAIVAMAHSMGMKVVAEGVETEEALSLVTTLGVDQAQGYLFSPAVPQDQLVKMLAKGTL
jgi:diguanylate cyclase (GGDEF)-like protein/PAS domain S-box-containing protein